MDNLEHTVEALLGRVAALEEENRQLRRQPRRDPPAGEHGLNRRQLFGGGAGLLGALAGGALLTPGQASTSSASTVAPAPAPGDLYLSDGVTSTQLARPTLVALRVTLAPERSGGHQWARYEWDLAAHFTGARAPVIIASALDDHHGAGPEAAPTCAVSVQGQPGAYRAAILVHNVGHWASAVTLTALAIGE